VQTLAAGERMASVTAFLEHFAFDMLMGNEVAPRKRFIQSHAKKVRNLDV
jgi:DNA gyrase/topoisomerase IV subunit B